MADILSIINAAAAKYGVDPIALAAIGQIESGLNPSAKNPRSSAGGLFQQIDSNAKQYGVSNRLDPVQSAEGAARFMRDNTRHLTKVLGRKPNVGELYLAHQQGPGGAAKILRDPSARAVDVVGSAAVKLNGGNANMTAAEFGGLWTRKATRAAVKMAGGEYTSPEYTGGGDSTLRGESGDDTLQDVITRDRGAIERTYQAFVDGDMSADERAAYEADVKAGRMSIPQGMSLYKPVTAEVAQIKNAFDDFQNGVFTPEQKAEYEADVRTGRMPLPEGVALEFGRIGASVKPAAQVANTNDQSLLPSVDTDTRSTAEFNGTGGGAGLDLTRQFAAESGGDLARQAAAGVTGSGPSPTASMLPENMPLSGPVSMVGDAGLALLGGAGAIGGAAAGLAGDAVQGLGFEQGGEALARDLAAMPEALAGSPVAMAGSAQRVAQAVPDTPNAPAVARYAPDAPVMRAEPPITQAIEAPRALGTQETNEMRTLIARAANNNTAARKRLAQMATVDPEAAAAAARLGIDVPVDVFATNSAVQKAVGSVRGIRGSDAAAEWEDTFRTAQTRANDIIEGQDGGVDLSAISARVQDDLTGSITTLRKDAGGIYNELRDQVPASTTVNPSASAKAINTIITDLGGSDSLPPPVRSLLNAVEADGGMTYGRLMQERAQIGRALHQKQGPYVDADSFTLGKLWDALGEDQSNFISAELGDAAAARLKSANGLWANAKDLEGKMTAGFGRDHNGSIANTLRSAVTNASKGDAGKLNKILDVVPENLQREAVMTALGDLSQARSGQGNFSFAQYAKTYRGLRNNSEIYSRISKVVGEDTSKIMRDLYEVSIRMDRASQNISGTGSSNQPLIGESLINGVLNSNVGRMARGVAAGSVATAALGPLAGSFAAVAASSSKIGKNRMDVTGALFRNPAFQAMAASSEPPTTAQIKALSRTPAFRRWAKAASIAAPDAWIAETLARGASLAPEPVTEEDEAP